jgi:hypothetical protein
MTASTIALVILSLAVIAALLHPLIVSAARDRRVSRGPSELDALLRRKAMLYANMKDLEFEHQMGKLSEADYARLRSEDRAEAARLLQEIDALEDAGDADAMIEREIAARQFGARDAATDALAARVSEGGVGSGEGAPEVEGRLPVAPRYSLGGRRPSTSDAPSRAASAENRADDPARSAGAAEDEASGGDVVAVVFCVSCGARSRTGDRFCWRCGAAIYAGGNE